MSWLALVCLSAAAYRVGRFIALDSMIMYSREKVAWWLQERDKMWAEKLLDLLVEQGITRP